MREDEGDTSVSLREAHEIESVGDLLVRPLARTMLPDVMQHRQPLRRSELANGIQERIVCATTGEQLHADSAARYTTRNFREGMRGVIRIHRHVPARTFWLGVCDGCHRVIAL